MKSRHYISRVLRTKTLTGEIGTVWAESC